MNVNTREFPPLPFEIEQGTRITGAGANSQAQQTESRTNTTTQPQSECARATRRIASVLCQFACDRGKGVFAISIGVYLLAKQDANPPYLIPFGTLITVVGVIGFFIPELERRGC